jgi:hypothetical protein
MFDGCMLGFLVVRIVDTGFWVAGPVCLQGHQQKGVGRPLQGHTAVGWVIAQGVVSVIAGTGCRVCHCSRLGLLLHSLSKALSRAMGGAIVAAGGSFAARFKLLYRAWRWCWT